MRFAIIRLGKDSVDDIKAINALHVSPEKPLVVKVECKQVPEELAKGDYAFICLGSDNNKGVAIDWVRGVRAFGRVTDKTGGPAYNDTWFVCLEVSVVLSDSVTQRDLLGKAPNAYFWCSDVPVLGVDTHANQTVQIIKSEEEHQKVEALLYGINAVRPAFKADVLARYGELTKLFSYVPPIPGGNAIEKHQLDTVTTNIAGVHLPKPFLLLAGISGTGKSRFVEEQAKSADEPYQLVAVRPDWHEPSDLLGYVSRLGDVKYVVTPFLKFLVRAWLDAFKSFTEVGVQIKLEMKTFWLCLDEMNLAPVEQYFADYLSILETRKWRDGMYFSSPLLNPSDLDEKVRESLRTELGLDNDGPLWSFFMEKGIQLAPNLVVAGTVNMDETTHGFSRKVIDRAYTIDFGEFFPNVFDEFFNQTKRPVKLSYSNISSVPQTGPGAAADPDGKQSIAFLSGVNQLLDGTPFQLAYRALNELLVTVACFAPVDDRHLRAVWDDFLMAKLLPRIEGDAQKIGDNENSLLNKLLSFLKEREFEGERPDLMRESSSGDAVLTPYRSTKKLAWMQNRLVANGFTSFWP